MESLHAIFLAVLQGLTEFLPVSSSAHLILVPKLLGWPDQGLAFDIAVHLGTLIAVVVFLRKDLQAIIPAWFAGWRTRSWDAQGQLAWFIILATVPVAIFGYFGSTWIENDLRAPMVIAASTAIFALLLWWSDRGAQSNTKSLSSLSWKSAGMVGLAQAFALIPGTSRSGVTMTALLALGYDRVSAARFSFLLAVPTIILPGLYKSTQLVRADTVVDWGSLLLGVTISAVVAFLCIRWFLAIIARIGMMPFVIYRLLLALGLWWVFS